VQYQSAPLTAARIQEADCVVVLTNHRNVDYRFVARNAFLIADTRNAFKNIEIPEGVLVRL
jgi:UDP-N-acetyl-D-glucosamine dehydrogenase